MKVKARFAITKLPHTSYISTRSKFLLKMGLAGPKATWPDQIIWKTHFFSTPHHLVSIASLYGRCVSIVAHRISLVPNSLLQIAPLKLPGWFKPNVTGLFIGWPFTKTAQTVSVRIVPWMIVEENCSNCFTLLHIMTTATTNRKIFNGLISKNIFAVRGLYNSFDLLTRNTACTFGKGPFVK